MEAKHEEILRFFFEDSNSNQHKVKHIQPFDAAEVHMSEVKQILLEIIASSHFKNSSSRSYNFNISALAVFLEIVFTDAFKYECISLFP